jgi:hypothetical protein
LKDGGGDAGNCPRNDQAHDGKAGQANPADGPKDAKIKGQNRHLCQANGDFVENLSEPVQMEGLVDNISVEQFGMLAESPSATDDHLYAHCLCEYQ